MSFQHFRLGELALHQPLPPHLMQHQGTSTNINGASSLSQFAGQTDNTNNSFDNNPPNGHDISSSSSTKQPYGSGDTDDGYTLVFPNIQAFHDWRNKEEETQMVEFVKGDTHGSKAVPPRFKDHTKLVCARHSRSGRKKYVKKHPERVRKVPSRKLDGQGCSASISFKTYFDTEEVRACYVAQHSHEIGLPNLPYTRRGRKAAVQQEKDRARKHVKFANDGSSETPAPMGETSTMQQANPFSSAVSMLAPLPGQPVYASPSQTYGYHPAPYPVPVGPLAQDRWDNMATLFQSIRENARSFEFPAPSVAALESCLIRLFLESPVGMASTQSPMGSMMSGGVSHPQHQHQQHHQHQHQQQQLPTPNTQSHNGSANMDGGSASDGQGSGSDESS